MKLLSIENKIISIRGQQVILDSDVAEECIDQLIVHYNSPHKKLPLK